MRPTLNELGLKYGTDKASSFHNYLDVYASYLEPRRELVTRVLEIGVDKGASLKMWRDYFPNALVTGLDNNPACRTLSLGERIRIVIGDALNPGFMLALKADCLFDLIIEDGAHTFPMTANAFAVAWPYVRPGGLYIIEDLHCVFHPKYCQPGVNGEQDGRWAMFLDQIQQLSKGEPSLCGDATKNRHSVRFMQFYRSLAIVGKQNSVALTTPKP
jgi:SAM-dependent methyltransferase